jgi:hypothetical protein
MPQASLRTLRNIDQASGDLPSQDALHRAGHGSTGLPCSDHLHSVEIGDLVTSPPGDQRPPVKVKMAENGRAGIGGPECRAKNLESRGAHVLEERQRQNLRRDRVGVVAFNGHTVIGALIGGTPDGE